MKKRNVIAVAAGLAVVLIQQIAIWESALGWLLVATLGLITLASGLMLRSDFAEEGAPGPA
jgi:hypothetical protein